MTILNIFEVCHVVFSCHSFLENVNFVVKFVEKLLHENKWYQTCHIFNTWKKEIFLFKWRNIYISFLFYSQFFISSQIWVIWNTFWKYYLSSELSSKNIQAEIKTFISLTNTSISLYLHYSNGAFCSPQEPFPSLSKVVKRDILEKIHHRYNPK